MEKRTEQGMKAKNEYIKSYQKSKMTAYVFRCNNSTDADIIDQLNRQDNKQGYIKRLIREDLKSEKVK